MFIDSILCAIWYFVIPKYVVKKIMTMGWMKSHREETVFDVIENCVGPSLLAIEEQFLLLLFFNLLFNFLVRYGKLEQFGFHIASTFVGLFAMYFIVLEDDLFVHIAFLGCGYLILYITYNIRRLCFTFWSVNVTYITELSCIIFLIYGEFYYPNEELWLKSRGIAMIAVMKIISLSHDFRGADGMLPLLPYAGYLLCPASSIFGPWLTYDEYDKLQHVIYPLNWKWALKILKSSSLALTYLCVSNCFGEFFIKSGSYKWLVAYRKALSFRTSHYFVSFVSEAAMITAGYNQLISDRQGKWEYTITRPLDVEIPRSLSNVVVAWNLPMHRFLKLYVYIIYLPIGKGFAIILTFFFSALLHGMNIEITLVLLSLGGFSYIQSISQRSLSDLISACVKTRPCTQCEHKFKARHPLTIIINIIFIFLNLIHLAYLGSVMDALSSRKSFFDTFLKWEILDLTSHHIFVIMFALYCIFGDFIEQ